MRMRMLLLLLMVRPLLAAIRIFELSVGVSFSLVTLNEKTKGIISVVRWKRLSESIRPTVIIPNSEQAFPVVASFGKYFEVG